MHELGDLVDHARGATAAAGEDLLGNRAQLVALERGLQLGAQGLQFGLVLGLFGFGQVGEELVEEGVAQDLVEVGVVRRITRLLVLFELPVGRQAHLTGHQLGHGNGVLITFIGGGGPQRHHPRSSENQGQQRRRQVFEHGEVPCGANAGPPLWFGGIQGGCTITTTPKPAPTTTRGRTGGVTYSPGTARGSSDTSRWGEPFIPSASPP